MGLGMPKFLSDGYNNFKERCNAVREGVKMIKMVFSLARKLEEAKFSDTNDPDAFVNAMKSTKEVPEPIKDILSSMDSEHLKKMTKLVFDMFDDKNKQSDGSNSTSSLKHVFQDTMEKMLDTSSDNKQVHSEESINPDKKSETRQKMADEFKEKVIYNETSKQTFQENKKAEPESSYSKTEEKESSSKNTDDSEYIPSKAYKDILGMSKSIKDETKSSRNSKEANDFENPFEAASKAFSGAKQNQTRRPSSSESQGKKRPPMADMLNKELEKKYGPNWRSRVPPFVHHPDMAESLPDLGLGLDKEGNRDMVLQMSKVIKDLL